MKKGQSAPETFSFFYEDAAIHSLPLELEKQTGGTYENNCFTLSSSLGEGELRTLQIEDGLFLRYFDFHFNTDIHFQARSRGSAGSFYHLYYFIDEQQRSVHPERLSHRYNITRNAVLIPPYNNADQYFQAGDTFKAIGLVFTTAWMEKNQLSTGPVAVQQGLLQATSFFDHNAACQVHRSISTGENISLQTRTNCLLLINRFFTELSSRNQPKPVKSSSSHLSEIVKLEARVCEHLDKDLPQLKSLAVQFHMSASTLKRHFKAVYGKNIYEYYLEKKMGLAKNLLQEKRLSISEVAYTLGYEKAGSLTSAFKKVFGFLPRDMKNCEAV